MSTESAVTTRNLDVVKALEPKQLWSFFAALSDIPRPSKHEQKVLSWLKAFATERSLQWRQDGTGNLVIQRPGTAGGEQAPTVVIQGHIDMVTEKNDDTVHDFFKDPILLRMDGEWLKATGTTLGADNGIGVATALALLDLPSEVKLPPLECLFTVDEETGLTGAKNIALDLVKGRTMLNLDTEEWGEIYVGCAGGGDTRIEVEIATEPAPPGLAPYLLRLDGLMGGHSGINIHEDRGNAVQLMARTLAALLGSVPGCCLVELRGGDKRNAIAREASAVILAASAHQEALAAQVAKQLDNLKAEYGQLESALSLRLLPQQAQQAQQVAAVMEPSSAARLLQLLCALPHGALKRSHAIAGLVETSNNVASVCPSAPNDPQPQVSAGPCQPVSYCVVTTTRSSLGHALEAVRDRVEAVAKAFGASKVERGEAYPGWAPNLQSPVLQVTREVYRQVLNGKDAEVKAIHAGLECGLLGEKFPGMDMVSYGPTIRGAHSPDECVHIPSVKPFFNLTLNILAALADKR